MSDPSDRAPQATPEQSERQTSPFLVVGIGASAGGIQALQTFFTSIPADIGMAFVVVMHLSPNYESNLAQILQMRTQMPVITVVEPVTVEPNHVYVISPNKHLSMEDSRIQLVEPQQPMGRRLAVDLFFRTLSVAYGPRAIAIVLTGADSDGVIGIKHIKEQGGLTIVQDPNEAEFDSMPRGAVATGMVDWILPVEEMPSQLVELMRNERRLHVPPEEVRGEAPPDASDKNAGGPLQVQQVPLANDEAALAEVLRFLRGQTGHDFAHYKRATILRRVARRLQVNLLEDIPSYLVFLRAHPAEVTALLHDLLISVTNFFRDRDAFAALESHIPQLFAGKSSSDQIRVWICGCATGEEAYSVTMLLLEHADRLDNPPSLLVFATDLDDEVIQVARAGLYPTTIEVDVSAERLRRFFQQDQGRYRIRKEVREIVLFSAHNVLKDPPFSRLDLVTCRNLLIYLKPEVQEGVMDIFHFALRPGGLMFLGASENLDDSHSLFAPLDKRYRLFVRRVAGTSGWRVPTLPVPSPAHGLFASPVLPRPPVSGTSLLVEAAQAIGAPLRAERRSPLLGDLHLALLERYAPPSLIVNANYDIVHLSEDVGRFLQFAAGEMSANLLKVAPTNLRTELRTALFRAVRDNTDVTVGQIPISLEGVSRQLTLHVRPGRQAGDTDGFLLVVFELLSEPRGDAEGVTLTPLAVAPHLEEENQYLRDQLRATSEQYEASLEELKASNEELQAMNEEIRSAAEELETSKEELQSINEELTTVNQELKSNVEELSRVNSDVQNLMASTEIGTIFLDRQLRIKRFTPRVQELFNLIAADVGRPLSDITNRLNYPNLNEDAERVLRDLRRTEQEVRSAGHWFLARILPYRTLEDRIDGVVLTFVDITERRQAEEALRESEERFRGLVTASSDAIFQMNADWSEMRNLKGMNFIPDTDSPSRTWMADYIPAESHPQITAAIRKAVRTGSIFELEHPVILVDGTIGWAFSRAVPLLNAQQEIVEWFGTATDFTERRRAVEKRLELEREATLMTERNRMAQELHDTLAQGFTGIKFQLEAAEAELAENKETAVAHLIRAREVAQESLDEARRSIHSLRSPLIEGDSLAIALQRLAEQTSNGVPVRFSETGTPRSLSALIESDLYRIGQEALTNALKHAQARAIRLKLTYLKNSVQLAIIDDGVGFQMQERRAGFGLTGMQERALRIGADLQIRSQPGQGTEVRVTKSIPHD